MPELSNCLIVAALLSLVGCATPSSDQTQAQPGAAQAKIEQIQNAQALIYIAKQREILQNGSDPTDKPDVADEPETPDDDGKD